MEKISVVREIQELKTILSYSKNVGFFFGAGTSCALGIPNINQLTIAVEGALETDDKANYQNLNDDLMTTILNRNANIEDVLNQARRIREITAEKEDKKYNGISGLSAQKLDKEICKNIYKIISQKESTANYLCTKKFFAWLNLQNRNFSKEIFTTNYDLIIEKSLEASQIPYFDGFVGAYEPFFCQESVDKFPGQNDLTQNWIRLWKIHGSLSWFWKMDAVSKTNRIYRIGRIEKIENENNELVIYPSKEKYESSKKLPFLAYFDRLKNYLLSGELLFIFTGYSFSDQHINEVIFNCLRQNNRLTIIVFFYQDTEVENICNQAASYLNLIVFGPHKAIINGSLVEWEYHVADLKPNEKSETYWDNSENKLTLGDFNCLVEFLISSSGQKELIDSVMRI